MGRSLQGRLLVIKFSSCRQARICKCAETNQSSRQKYAFDSHFKKGGVSGESRQNYKVLHILIFVISVFAMLELKQSCFNVYFHLLILLCWKNIQVNNFTRFCGQFWAFIRCCDRRGLFLKFFYFMVVTMWLKETSPQCSLLKREKKPLTSQAAGGFTGYI